MFAEFIAASLLLAQSSTPATIQIPASQDAPAKPLKDIGSRSPQEWAAACEDWDEWEKPAPPFEIVPRLHYVGSCGITALIVIGEQGNVLIDTGTDKGARLVLESVERALVDPSFIRLILTSHEHFDHAGGLAHLQHVTGAPALSSAVGARVLATGMPDTADPQAGMHEPMKPAPAVIGITTDEPVYYGGMSFTPIATPGHTPGALSWQWDMCDAQVCHSVVYADSLSPVSRDDYRFSDHPEYVTAYRAGLQRLREAKCDILLTPHPSASNMIERAASGSLVGGMTCVEYADAVEKRLASRLAKEKAGE